MNGNGLDKQAGEKFVHDVGQVATELRELRLEIKGLRDDLEQLLAVVRSVTKGGTAGSLLASLLGRR